MERSTMDLWVGIFVISGFVALLFLALKVGNLNVGTNDDTYTVTARFDNIGGLKVRAPVRASGVVVGRVSRVAFDNTKYEANVIITVDAKYKFPKDTTASILTSGILGENYVGLDAGGDSDMLKEGDKIQITQSAVVLERLIGQFLFDKAQGGNDKPAPGADKPKAGADKIPDGVVPAKK
jgi:phospholipid/cholesterol/gamma-HCH transport system substrate-binding protein